MPLSKNFRLSLAALYFVFISVLFTLPGSAFPKDDWLGKIWFDKWVHIGLFVGLSVAWSWALGLTTSKSLRVLFFILSFYGILVEVVQHQYIANRSFDVGDWIADMAGSLLGIWFWWYRYKKNRPL
jgi:VanZ family protein